MTFRTLDRDLRQDVAEELVRYATGIDQVGFCCAFFIPSRSIITG